MTPDHTILVWFLLSFGAMRLLFEKTHLNKAKRWGLAHGRTNNER